MEKESGEKESGGKDSDSARLEAAALDYLARFAASTEQLRRVLLRKLRRWALLNPPADPEAGTDPAKAAAMTDAVIAKLERAGLLDDAKFAELKAGSLLRRGNSGRAIRFHLAQKGVAPAIVADTIAALQAETPDLELTGAAALLRRRRLGCYRPTETREAYFRKDLASLARAGFRESVARRVLACADALELEEILTERNA